MLLDIKVFTFRVIFVMEYLSVLSAAIHHAGALFAVRLIELILAISEL